MSDPPPAPAVFPLGESAWTIALGDRVEAETNQRVTALATRITAADFPGVQEIVPAYAAVTVFFDPLAADADGLRDRLVALALESSARPTVRPSTRPTVIIPVHYAGPDLEEVAQRTGLGPEEVIRRHAAREYRVYLLGFAPGFGYLGDLDPALVLPRRSTPRTRVPAGSVAIAGSQTGVYPLATPGGWHLIGSTALTMFDPARDPPSLLAPGDRVRFEAVP